MESMIDYRSCFVIIKLCIYFFEQRILHTAVSSRLHSLCPSSHGIINTAICWKYSRRRFQCYCHTTIIHNWWIWLFCFVWSGFFLIRGATYNFSVYPYQFAHPIFQVRVLPLTNRAREKCLILHFCVHRCDHTSKVT